MLDRADQSGSPTGAAGRSPALVVMLEAETVIAAASHLDENFGVAGWRAARLADVEAGAADAEPGGLVLVAIEDDTPELLARYEGVIAALARHGARVFLLADEPMPTAEDPLLAAGAEGVLLWPITEVALARILGREDVLRAEAIRAEPPRGAFALPDEPPIHRPFGEAPPADMVPSPGARLDPEVSSAPPLEAAQALAFDAAPPRAEPASAGGGDGAVISVFRVIGGAGATTLAVNLAWELAEESAESSAAPGGHGAARPRGGVALLDLDLQNGAATSHLDIGRSAAGEGLFLGEEPLSMDALLGAMVRRNRLTILPAPRAIMPLDAAQPDRIDRLIELAADYFTYVVIDTPPALTVWSEPILRRSGRSLMAARDLSLHEANAAARLFETIQEEGVSSAKFELVLNGAPSGLDWSRKARIKKFETLAGRAFSHELAEGGAAPRDAADAGIPLGEIERRNPLRLSIKKLAAAQKAAVEAARR